MEKQYQKEKEYNSGFKIEIYREYEVITYSIKNIIHYIYLPKISTDKKMGVEKQRLVNILLGK